MSPRIFIERPITSVEDAEGLPVGTVAVAILDDGRVADAAVRRDDLVEPWEAGAEAGRSYTHAQMIGFTALVPVEAEEERRPAWHMAGTELSGPATRRLRTPWEVAD